MKNKLLTLALAGTLILGNGCKPKLVNSYTTHKEGNEVTLRNYWHWLDGNSYEMEVKRPNGDSVAMHADNEAFYGPRVSLVKINPLNQKTASYYGLSEENRRMLRAAQPQFTAYFKAIKEEQATNTQKRVSGKIESSSLFKQFE